MEKIARRFVELGADWIDELHCLFAHIGHRFGRVEMQQRALEYLVGLLSPIERKNGWQLAEAAAHAAPYSMQHLLDRAPWDADAVRDDLTDYVVEELGEADGVLVADETGFVKKGAHSAGVQRQYSGTAGRIENCQVGVFLSYASRRGRALMDRELYLPREWADDKGRREAAKVPEEVEFATKPQLAQRMIERAVAAQVPFAWITGDEVYGDNRSLRVWLEQQGLHFVLAVRCNQYVWPDVNGQMTVEQLATTVAPQDWATLSAGDGAKGPRLYDWVRIPLLSWQMAGERWLLLRRSRSDGKLAYYVCYVPSDTDLQAMVRVAGTRWTVEECFEATKGEVGLDHYEVRSWHGWYRHITLAMIAHAYLAALCADAAPVPVKKKMPPSRMRQWKQQRLHTSR
ncbi:MAG TPA: IS701 family transposase [Noviherbaspirillum sp.]|nr:IS701 family transposase [Noviherbaspirillum sp.]